MNFKNWLYKKFGFSWVEIEAIAVRKGAFRLNHEFYMPKSIVRGIRISAKGQLEILVFTDSFNMIKNKYYSTLI